MSHSLIDPSQLPGQDLDLASVSQAAADIAARAASITQGGSDVAAAWSALPASYESSGAEGVYAAMGPVRDAAERVGGDLASVADALDDWVSTVQPILNDLATLRSDAEAFVQDANSFQPKVESTGNWAVLWLPVQVDNWWEDPDMVSQNNALIGRGYLLSEQLRVANEDLANAIRRAAGLSTTAVTDAATTAPDGLETPWGDANDREESCAEKAVGFQAHFDLGVLQGAWDMVGGVGMLLGGYDFKSWPPPTWQIAGDLLTGNTQAALDDTGTLASGWGQAWVGVGHLITGVSMGVAGPLMTEVVEPWAIDTLKGEGADTSVLEGFQQWQRDSFTSYVDLFGSFVGYQAPEDWWQASGDEWAAGWSDWATDPGGTAGTSVFNIATLVLPVKGGGSVLDGLKGARAGTEGAETLGADAARAGGAADDLARAGTDLEGARLRIADLSADAKGFAAASDDLAASLGKSPLDDAGALADDLRTPNHIDQPAPTAHAGDRVTDPTPKAPETGEVRTATEHASDTPPQAGGVDNRISPEHDVSGPPPGEMADTHGTTSPAGVKDGRIYTRVDNGQPVASTWAPEQTESWVTARDEVVTALEGTGRSIDELDDLIHRPTDTLSNSDIEFLHDLRQKVSWDDETVFQKVIPPGEDVARVMGTYMYAPDTLSGFVTRLQDAIGFRDSQGVYSGLRLDYPNSEFHSLVDGPVQMIRYQRDGGSVEIPFNSSVAGHPTRFTNPSPFTGNGFTASGLLHSDGGIIPEFYTSLGTKMRAGAEMWEVTPSGTYRLLAVLDADVGWVAVTAWKPVLP